MSSPLSRMDALALARGFFGSARFANALTLSIIGAAVCADSLQRLLGWAGFISIVVTLVLLATATLLSRRGDIDWQGLLPVSLLIFVGWASLSLFWSEYQWASAAGVAYLLAFTMLGVTVALLRDTIQIVRAFGDVLRFVLAVSLGVEILSGLIIDTPLVFLGVQGNLDDLGPIQGLMGSRNQLGLVALIALITFGTEYRTRSVSRGVGLGSMVLAILAIALSRSPIIGAVLVVVAAAALVLYLLRRVRAERRTIWQLGVLGAAVLLAIIAWLFRSRIIEFFSANSELSYRVSLWRGVWALIERNPLEGWGWVGQWRPEVQPFPLFAVPGEREPASAVNAYLDVWFQLGLVGIFIFAVLVTLAFARSWLLAGHQRSVIFAWPALVLVALIVTALAESSILIEYGWLTFVVCSVKASRELSWRRAFARSAGGREAAS